MADKYILSVTAGPTYEDQKPIPINTEQPTRIDSPHLTASLTVRIQNYRGLPKDSPKTSPYFSHPKHEKDLYSLGFTFTPKFDLNGHDIVFGNDFDHPIRDKLPPGFNQAFKIATWFIDPGLYGDVYSDEPYLYGPLLSSINTLRIGPKDDKEQEKVEEARNQEEVLVFEEGADGDGAQVREDLGIPGDVPARQKHFLQEGHLKDFTFEKGREYSLDFFNPYLDFNDFALRLPGYGFIPGITIPIISYWDGQPLRSHSLRYVLKNRATDDPLFVVVFTLLPKDGEASASISDSDSKEKQKEGAAIGDDDLDWESVPRKEVIMASEYVKLPSPANKKPGRYAQIGEGIRSRAGTDGAEDYVEVEHDGLFWSKIPEDGEWTLTPRARKEPLDQWHNIVEK